MQIITVPVGSLQENCYVVYMSQRENALLIDPGDEPDKIRAALGDRQPVAILLTHGHYDHTGALGAFPGLPIYMHEADAPLLSQRSFSMEGYQVELAPRPEPSDFVTDGQIIKLAGISLQVLHTPGHTPGSLCYRSGDSMFTGDTLFDGDYGRTDLPGGSMVQMRASLRRLLGMHGCRAYPGHGGNFVIP